MVALSTIVAAVAGVGCGDDVSSGVDAGPAGDGDSDGGAGDAAMPPDPESDAGADAAIDDEDSGTGDPADSGIVDPELPAPITGVAFERVEAFDAEGQSNPHEALTGIVALPDGSGMLVWEKAGRVSHYELDGESLSLVDEFLVPDVHGTSDCGLVSVVPDPDWPERPRLWAAHCIDAQFSRVSRFYFNGRNHADVADTAATVLEVGEPTASKNWHNIGAIGFFDDEYKSMWVLVGEKTRTAHAQDTTTNLGALLRIRPYRDASGYEPHPDNPFFMGSAPSSGEDIYAWGLRSPWRGSVDEHGRVYIGDVGSKHEEINVALEAGHNFGWGITDGPCNVDGCEGTTQPTVSWNRGSGHRYRADDASAVSTSKRCAWVGEPYRADGADVYEGFLDDSVLFSDMCVGYVRALSIDAEGAVVRDEHVGHLVGLSGAAQGPDGYLYVTSFGSCSSSTRGLAGGIYRVVPHREQAPEPPPEPGTGSVLVDDPLGPLPLLISELGIFEDAELTQPIARAIEYEPIWPLWTSGSDKTRWLLLPEGTTIDSSDPTALRFPVGTLFFKTFAWPEGPGRVETRVMRRSEEGWEFHAYIWRPGGGEADLVSLQDVVPREVTSGGQTFWHHVPSRFDCRSCHESNPTPVIGFDLLRLNGARQGASDNQLEALVAAGVFSDPLPEPLPTIDAEDTATRDALGYLHGNCTHCHNSGPTTMSALDLDPSVALDNLLGEPVVGSGQAAGIRVVPGSAAESILFQALARQGDDPELQPMPPLGVQLVDSAAVEMIRSWIDGLPAE